MRNEDSLIQRRAGKGADGHLLGHGQPLASLPFKLEEASPRYVTGITTAWMLVVLRVGCLFSATVSLSPGVLSG